MADKIAIIGTGEMGSALARGLAHTRSQAGQEQKYQILVHDKHADRVAQVAKDTGSTALANATDLKGAAAVLFCVKPQDFSSAAAFVAPHIDANCLVVTILAGVEIADVQATLAQAKGIVRAMPNIAGFVAEAATVLCANADVTDAQKALAEDVFDRIGRVAWTGEELLDAVTGLSGSGPAYVFMVIESLIDGGVKMGLSRNLATELAVQTVVGAAKLVQATGEHPAVLKDRVTTPGGTTINAIHDLENRGLRAMLISAVETATVRSADLRAKARK